MTTPTTRTPATPTAPGTPGTPAAPAVRNTGAALALRGVRLGHRGNAVLDRIDLAVEAGEVLTVVGPSGCGKSTLLRTLAGLLPPLGGTVEQDGAPVTGPDADRALVFQDDALLPWRTVRANVELPSRSAAPPAPRAGGLPRDGWSGSAWAGTRTSSRTSSRAGSASACSWPAPSPRAPAPS